MTLNFCTDLEIVGKCTIEFQGRYLQSKLFLKTMSLNVFNEKFKKLEEREKNEQFNRKLFVLFMTFVLFLCLYELRSNENFFIRLCNKFLISIDLDFKFFIETLPIKIFFFSCYLENRGLKPIFT